MAKLEVPGAILSYNSIGSGPLLLFIPGADGRGSVFEEAAKLLAPRYTVVLWDRRGFSKSLLVGPQDFEHRLDTDADDANQLIEHLATPGHAVVVFGTSSGAIVAQRLLCRYPNRITCLIAHEPPSFSVLPEDIRNQAIGLTQHVYETYRAQGVATAMEVFTAGLSEGEDAAMMRFCMDSTRSDEIRANSMFWFEFELRQYTSSTFDLASIKTQSKKYIPAAGITSGDGPGVGPVSFIAKTLKKDIVRLPGGHIAYMTEPLVFTTALLKELEKLLAM
ncbi:Alpha/Beta hydrolase protein [Tricladium varicosporioides]|nr:Alpha/Beta hydrolase protein [Hymenoscyphus varicosporioides]